MEIRYTKEEQPILSIRPPVELIPRGYNKKVIIMWLSFFGVIFGAANLGGPLGIVLPMSMVVLVVDLVLVIYARFNDKPIWLYKEAQESYYRSRYNKALIKLNQILELRPDVEEKLLPALVVCKNRTGDLEGAAECCKKLFQQGSINHSSNPVLLLEILKIMRSCGEWERVLEVADYLPKEPEYEDWRNYYKGISYYETGQASKALEYFNKIANTHSFLDLELYINRNIKTTDGDNGKGC